jgi:hypothetical protein
MDRFLSDKWLGRIHSSNTIFDFSSAYNLYLDKFQYFKTDELYF